MFVYLFNRSAHSAGPGLFGWLADWLVGLFGWLVGCFFVCLLDWLLVPGESLGAPGTRGGPKGGIPLHTPLIQMGIADVSDPDPDQF